MSEILTKSMYDNFPFEKCKQLGQVSQLTAKLEDIKRRLRFKLLMWRLNRESIAENRIDFRRLTRFTADQFPESGPLPWLDRPDAEAQLSRRVAAGEVSQQHAAIAREFRDEGYTILPKFFDADLIDEVWTDYDRLVFDGKVPIETFQQKTGDLFLGRCLNAHLSAPGLKRLTKDPRILDFLSFLLGVRATPFQTIIGYAGSEQRAHSDSIHMSTWPLGYLVAIWIAMEDIHPDCGPLEYYPRSHRLPYLFSHKIDRQPRDLQHKRTSWYNEVYEDEIEGIVVKENIGKKFLLAKKGDLLIWHANLIHGGSPRHDKRLSRKALVAHYFGKGAFCYGDRNEMFCDPYQAE